MKVKCIKTSGYILTVGKIYDVELYTNKIFGEYYIINDVGMRLCMRKELFENISEIRDEKLKQLGI